MSLHETEQISVESIVKSGKEGNGSLSESSSVSRYKPVHAIRYILV